MITFTSGSAPNWRLLALFFAALAVPLLGAQSQTPATITSVSQTNSQPAQEASTSPPTTQPADRAIPLPQIADRADDLDRWLREITGQLAPTADLLKWEEETKNQSEGLRTSVNQASELLASTPTTLELQNEQRFWRILNQKYAAEREILTSRAAELEKQLHRLDEEQLDWQATWDQIHQKTEIKPVVDRTRQELDLIQTTRVDLQKQLNLILTLQTEVSQMDRKISDVVSRVREAQGRSGSRLLEPDSPPLWRAYQIRTLDQAMQTGFRRSIARSSLTTSEFLRAQKLGILSIVTTYFLTLIGAFKLRRHVERGAGVEVSEAEKKIFALPFSVALLVGLAATIIYLGSAPFDIVFVIYVLYLIPVLRLLSPLLEPRLRALLHLLAVFYLLEVLYLLIRFPPLVGREVHALIILAALISFGWFARPSQFQEISTPGRSLRMVKIGIWVGLALLASSLAANFFGFESLAQISGVTALLGTFAGVGLYCAARILMLVLATVLRTNWAQSVLEARVNEVERWAWRVVTLCTLFLWVTAVLRVMTVYDVVVGAISSALTYPLGFERVHITLGAILSFSLILLVGYTVSNSITFALRRVLLSSLPLQRGLPFAVSKVTYYVLLVLVFIAALINAGMDLNKFTLVTGAVGVGVGFGLQNIVNNFVSGLVLLFERPIRVGDTVEVSGLVGRVRRIGARSSTIHTFTDAEVIVPNSDLISKEVINWTLSSARRRVDIPVGVAYGTDPQRVLSLLIEVAEAHSWVIKSPNPEAYFLGFGESAMNFELRCWTYHEAWLQLKSEVAIGVVKALCEAGIVIPFPQRDLHIRTIEGRLAKTSLEKDMFDASSEGANRTEGVQATVQQIAERRKKSQAD